MKAVLIILWILFVLLGTAVISIYPAAPTPAAESIPIAEQRTAAHLESIRYQHDELQAFLKITIWATKEAQKAQKQEKRTRALGTRRLAKNSIEFAARDVPQHDCGIATAGREEAAVG